MIEKESHWYKIKNDLKFRKSIIDALSYGIDGVMIIDFTKILNYVIDDKWNLFESKLKGKTIDGEDDIQDLILPSIRRVYAYVFITPPEIFKNHPSDIKGHASKRMQLFQLSFDIDEFVDYLIDMMIKNGNILSNFLYLDRTATILSLIVDNYIAELVDKVRNCDDFDSELRDVKITKIQK